MRKFLLLFFLIVFCFFTEKGFALNLDQMLANANRQGKVVMLELGSVGCIPCEKMRPVMDKLKTKYNGKLDVIFVDVREDEKTARRYGVYVIPTQVFLDKNGKEFHRHIGFYSYEDIVRILQKVGL